MFVSLISLVLLYIVIAFTLDVFYFRKLRLWRIVFHSVLLFVAASIMFGIVQFFNPELGWGFFIVFVLFSLGGSIVVGIANYFNLMFVEWRIKKLREKYSKLPDGPQKEGLMRMLDRLESKKRA